MCFTNLIEKAKYMCDLIDIQRRLLVQFVINMVLK